MKEDGHCFLKKPENWPEVAKVFENYEKIDRVLENLGSEDRKSFFNSFELVEYSPGDRICFNDLAMNKLDSLNVIVSGDVGILNLNQKKLRDVPDKAKNIKYLTIKQRTAEKKRVAEEQM